jgi:PKD repeat protein
VAERLTRSGLWGRMAIVASMLGTGLVVAGVGTGIAVVVGALTAGPAAAAPPPAESAYLFNHMGTPLQVVPVGALQTSKIAFLPLNGRNPVDEVVSPDGDLIYMASTSPNVVVVLDATTGQAVRFLPLTAAPERIALSPDGTRLWVVQANDAVDEVNTQTGEVMFQSNNAAGATSLAISADGSLVYVTTGTNRSLVVLSGGIAVRRYNVDCIAADVVLTPSTFFVACGDGGGVLEYDTSTGNLLTQIPTGGQNVSRIVLTPDGSRLFIATDSPMPVQEYDTTGAFVTSLDIDDVANMAITPDGRQLWVLDDTGALSEWDTVTNSQILPGQLTALEQANLIDFVPDQAPVARFTVPTAVAGQPVTLDGSTSTTLYGTITSYAWDFGDGMTTTTSTPTVSHTYASSGDFHPTLTVTNSAGTSTTAIYNGRDMVRNGGPSARATGTVHVAAHPSTVTITSSVNPAHFGQAVTITATVTNGTTGGPKPTGQFVFDIDGITQAPVTLSAGKATLHTTTLGVGERAIGGTYPGDSVNPPVTAAPLTVEVQFDATTTTITSSANPAVSGQSGSVTINVTPVAPGGGVPTGLIEVFIDGDGGQTLTLTAGKVTVSLSSLSPGAHTISALYTGDLNYLLSLSSNFSQEIDLAGTTTTLATTASPAAFGQPGSITATVRVVAPGTGSPTGTVTFSVDGVNRTPTTLTGGKATLPLSSLAPGTHTVTATYSGDGAMQVSSSNPLMETINPAVTTLTQTTTRTTIHDGQSATVTATLKVTAPGSGTPTGGVVFTVDGVAEPSVPLSGGKAQLLVTTVLGSGSHTIVASYAGDGNYAGSTSSSLTETVS